MAMAARMLMMTTTIRSSISVKPLRRGRMMSLVWFVGGPGWHPPEPARTGAARSDQVLDVTLRLARRGRRVGGRSCRLAVAGPDRALLGSLGVRRFGPPALHRRVSRTSIDRHAAARGIALNRSRDGRTTRGEIRARVIGGITLLCGHEVTKVALHGREVRLLLRVRELRDRDRGQNADDHDDDQELDQGKAFPILVLHESTPVEGSVATEVRRTGRQVVRHGQGQKRRASLRAVAATVYSWNAGG